MKKRIKDFVKRKPMMKKLYKKLFEGNLFKPSYTKSIRGEGNKLLFNSSAIFVKCKIDIKGRNNELIVKDSAYFLNVSFFIRGNNNKILISRNVRFKQGGSLWIDDDNCEITIGEDTTFEETHIALAERNSKVVIGNDCMFAYDIDIRAGDSHSIIDTVTNKRINFAQGIEIGDHVWVAAHVSILKNVKIASNSVVATRSLVTKKFDQENVLIGGAPAKILKENITWKRERIYES